MCCIRDVTLPLLLKQFRNEEGPFLRVEECSQMVIGLTVEGTQLLCTIGPNGWFFFPSISLIESPVTYSSFLYCCFLQYDGQRCSIFICTPAYYLFENILRWVFLLNGEVTVTAAPHHGNVEKFSMCCVSKGNLERVRFTAHALCQEDECFPPAGGRKENAFMRERAKALSEVALWLSEIFPRYGDSNLRDSSASQMTWELNLLNINKKAKILRNSTTAYSVFRRECLYPEVT